MEIELTDAMETLTLPVPVVANPTMSAEVPDIELSVLRLETVPTREIAIDATRSMVNV
tara:strand:+ start:112 stop:285 length:174 start_codon:yes stop_codon:yes gene_type:complete